MSGYLFLWGSISFSLSHLLCELNVHLISSTLCAVTFLLYGVSCNRELHFFFFFFSVTLSPTWSHCLGLSVYNDHLPWCDVSINYHLNKLHGEKKKKCIIITKASWSEGIALMFCIQNIQIDNCFTLSNICTHQSPLMYHNMISMQSIIIIKQPCSRQQRSISFICNNSIKS